MWLLIKLVLKYNIVWIEC